MAHNHRHGHSAHHSHARPKHDDPADTHGRRLLWVTLINVGILVLEIVGGLISNSLALLSDAVHKLGDIFSLVVAWLANRFGKRKADYKKTFGYKRIEILAALFNALLLVGICVFLVIEAYGRFLHPQPIRGGLMLVIALIGLVADFLCVLILNKNRRGNINVRAAYLHLLGDALSSVAVIAGGVTIFFWGVEWVDPVITVIVCLFLIYQTWNVLKESVNILMQSTPAGIDPERIRQELEAIPGVDDIHHIHIWQLTDSDLYLEGHVNVAENIDILKAQSIRRQMERLLNERFGIDHTTLQFEYRCCPEKGLIVFPEDNRE